MSSVCSSITTHCHCSVSKVASGVDRQSDHVSFEQEVKCPWIGRTNAAHAIEYHFLLYSNELFSQIVQRDMLEVYLVVMYAQMYRAQNLTNVQAYGPRSVARGHQPRLPWSPDTPPIVECHPPAKAFSISIDGYISANSGVVKRLPISLRHRKRLLASINCASINRGSYF